MKLDALPAGETQSAVAVGVGQLVQGQVLLRRHPSAGDLAADHEHIMLAQSFAAAGFAGVAVLLLIGAVKLEELFILLAEMIAVLPHLFADGAAQGATALLDPFHRRTIRLLHAVFGGAVRVLPRFDRHTFILPPIKAAESSLIRSNYLYSFSRIGQVIIGKTEPRPLGSGGGLHPAANAAGSPSQANRLR